MVAGADALTSGHLAAEARDHAVSRTDHERILTGIWSDILRTGPIGLDDNFFDLGGNSLAATQVLSRVADRFGVRVRLARLFEAPTIGALARLLAGETEQPAPAPLSAAVMADRPGQLSFAQERMWFLSKFSDADSAYMLPMVVRITGTLELGALRQALARVVDRQAILRTTYAFENGQPSQRVEPSLTVPLRVVDVVLDRADTVEQLATRLARAEVSRPIDLSSQAPLRVSLVRLAADDALLVIVAHHIAVDGWSKSILFDELAAAYAAVATGTATATPIPAVTYADFAVAQRHRIAGAEGQRLLGFWRRQLAGAAHTLQLPTDRPRPARQAFTGATIRHQLTPVLADRLRAVARAHGCSLYMVMLAAFNWQLAHYSRQTDILVGTPTAGRSARETEAVIGLFVNTIVMRGNLAGNPTFATFLARTREQALDAYEHQDLPLEHLIEGLRVERHLDRSPLVQVLFQVRNYPPNAPRFAGATSVMIPLNPGTAQLDLNLEVVESPAGLECALIYCDALFDDSTASSMLLDFATILESVATRPEMRRSQLPALRVQPTRVAAAEASTAFWRQRFGDAAAPTPLVIGQTARADRTPVERPRVASPVDPSAVAALSTRLSEHGISTGHALLGAWAIVLGRYVEESRVVLGVSGWPDAPRTTLPVRIDIAPQHSVLDIVTIAYERWLESAPHAATPLDQLPGLSQLAASALRFESQVVVGSDDQPDPDSASPAAILSVDVDGHSGLRVVIDFDPARLDPAAAGRAAAHVCRVLEALAVAPATIATAIDLVSADERRQQVTDWNRTDAAFSDRATLQSLFDTQVARTPDAVALVFGETTLTYAELQTRARLLGQWLRSRGVGPDVLVGLCVERSVEMVVGLLGILEAGGAYVPLDPTYPEDRLAFMLSDAGVSTLLTQVHLLSRLPAAAAATVCLDRDWPAISAEARASTAPRTTSTADDLAYMIYTSGSTGRPKGALNAQRGIVNRLEWMQAAFGLTADDVVLQKTPFSFDVSVWEFFWPLSVGARLVMAQPGGHQDPAYLVDLIARARVSVLHFVPSMLRVFLETPRVSECRSIRALICSGEALPADLVDACHAALPAEVHNLYGPTEAAVDVTWWACPRGAATASVPIGRPITNTQCYILDATLRPVPIGATGELHLGGVQVGRGYHGRPELTAERFIADPFRPGPDARLYKTGDRCRFRSDGNIEYLGRLDHQVKIRGLRIELGEIESALLTAADLKDVAVVVDEAGGRDKRLVAYVVPRQTTSFSTAATRDRLAASLPDYMVPAAFMVLDALPLSPNGKLDRKALPALTIDATTDARTMILPANDLEQVIAAVWCEVLGLSAVGTTESFFEAGGDSLKLIRVQHRLHARLGRQIPVVELFQHPSIHALAQHLAPRVSATGSPANAVSSVQERAQRQREAAQRRRPVGSRP